MTGKMNLNDMVMEMLQSLGHKRDDYMSPSSDKIHFKIQGAGYKTYNYYVMLNSAKNTARFSVGTFPDFDFHDPGSVTLFKCAALQLPTLIALRDISEQLLETLRAKDDLY